MRHSLADAIEWGEV